MLERRTSAEWQGLGTPARRSIGSDQDPGSGDVLERILDGRWCAQEGEVQHAGDDHSGDFVPSDRLNQRLKGRRDRFEMLHVDSAESESLELGEEPQSLLGLV